MTLRDMIYAIFRRMEADPGIGWSHAAELIEKLINDEVEFRLHHRSKVKG